MPELTQGHRDIIIAFASFFTGSTKIYFHKFANRPGYMLVIETKNLDGFKNFLTWFHSEMELEGIDIIRTLSEEGL
ncbi:hypothetical protein P9274_20050 [Schinkia azotoformans]|uniref:hypothetical protein n=1 Tax=Schinkia azotoformans TaxID=1454 RepID=UPI002E23F224|nr:hypothetical protein [Schinkia azotoformans]